MNSEYKIGQQVRIKKHIFRYYDDPGLNDAMSIYFGTCVRIIGIVSSDRKRYIVNSNGWQWDGRWLESVRLNKLNRVLNEI